MIQLALSTIMMQTQRVGCKCREFIINVSQNIRNSSETLEQGKTGRENTPILMISLQWQLSKGGIYSLSSKWTIRYQSWRVGSRKMGKRKDLSQIVRARWLGQIMSKTSTLQKLFEKHEKEQNKIAWKSVLKHSSNMSVLFLISFITMDVCRASDQLPWGHLCLIMDTGWFPELW